MADTTNIKQWLAEVLGTETYDGDINEFVDWVTGNNSLTNRNVSGGLPISGASIRKLLQDRLKQPFVVYEDENAGLYRMFSSEASRDRWISNHETDPESVAGLEMFNFERPSEFVLSTTLSSDPRYIIKGDEESEDARINFTVALKDKEGVTKSDGLLVTYSIVNNITGVTTTHSEPYGPEYVNNIANPISINIYDLLQEGINTITINIKANTISSSIDIGFSVYLINFSLSSTFDFNLAKTVGSDIEIPFEINRSSVVSGSKLNVYAYIDGNIANLASNGADALWNTTATSTRVNGSMKIKNIYAASTLENPHVSHSLRLEAQMITGNSTFYSNVLYYTFEIASEANDVVNRFVNIGTSISYGKMVIEDGVFLLQGTQYSPFSVNWSYYTDQVQNEQSIDITWAIKTIVNEQVEYKTIATVTGVKNKKNTFTFIPENSYSYEDNVYLVALYNGVEIDSYPFMVEESYLTIAEATGYDLKLSAYGKTNSSPTRDIWKDETHNIGVTFTGVSWDSTSGWDSNSFFTIGESTYADIAYVPFPNNFGAEGRTLEVEFKSEQVNDDDDILIDLGSPNAGRITITPTKATVWLNGTEVISTHYKANEKTKLAFIFNKTENNTYDGNLVYIVNNGILERAAGIGTVAAYTSINGIFRIGGSQSGIRVYTIRAYPFALSYNDAYNNFVYDSENKAVIVNRNNIVSGNEIVYDECAKKIDTVLIEGNLQNILNRDVTKKDSESTVNITYHCVSDSTRNFVVTNGKIRKHGQSTLNYPITSMKIWFNKSSSDSITPSVTLSAIQNAMGLNKGRYVMKEGAIPANKFVLQANYADSSGANNGALERLIQDTWYNAKIDGEYKLRTAPQLFSSGELVNHNDSNLNESGDNAWVEGYGTDTGAGKTWSQIANKAFPYKIRTAPDSFPCAVFYRNTSGSDTSIHFLGQYVFMDDKKSDHVYGERSIYHYYDETDPFCLKTDNKDQDSKENRVWNNNKVVRIECVLLDNVLTSFMGYNVPSVATDSVNQGATVSCDTIKYDEKGNKLNFYWEDYFEMIYPDPDDFEIKVNGVKVPEDKFVEGSQFREKAQYFLNFLQWITGIASLNSGTKIEGYKVTQAALNQFIATAHDHIDPWKMAAYYIFFLRFGLVDSVERNVQLKTYDGQHWHYEPWDMDIAVGNKNDGGFAFYPPMNRDTTLPTDASTYAYSGRSTTTSNVLWDCLEAWEYWRNTVVPKVAQSLYEAGLSYANITEMFDENYSNKWSEVMYNNSGHYKYVEMRGNDNDWLAWLQGAGISHRHWWLSSSMNYYDAMWAVGDFQNHRVYIAVNKEPHAAGTDIITIKPTSSTFFKLTQGDGTISLGTLPASKDAPAQYDISSYSFSKKDPSHIYGATFIEELDLSCFAQKLAILTLTGAYDSVLGAPIKKLNVGIPMTMTSDTTATGYVSGTKFALSASSEDGDALANLKVLDITGQQSITNTESLLYSNNRRTVTDIYAAGTGLTSFFSARSGNKFNELRLPNMTIKTNSGTGVESVTSKLDSIRMVDSSWENISFWITRTSDEIVIEEAAEEGEEPVIRANQATFTKTGVPATITTVQFEGSTASNECAAQFVMDWLSAIADKVAAENPSLSGEALENKVLQVLSGYKLEAENIYWGTGNSSVKIYYSDLARIAALNEGNNQNSYLKGYIMISDQEELSSVQVTQLRDWFGESVFNKSNINSGLIIDQQLGSEYVQVNVGRDAYIDTDENDVEGIYLKEGHSATLNATKFLLSEDPDEYVWTISSAPSGSSVILKEGNDGIWRIIANEGTIGDYAVTVTARQGSITKDIVINIVGVTYPDDWVFKAKSVSGSVREFSPGVDIAKSIFGSSRVYQSGSATELRDCYVIYNTNQKFEFYIEAVNGAGTTATYKSTSYSVTRLDTNTGISNVDSEQFRGDANTVATIDGEYLYSYNAASNNPIAGIVIGTQGTIPTDAVLYTITATVSIGGTQVVRFLNILMISDSAPIVKSNRGVLYNVLRSKVESSSYTDLYKTDLMSIGGELDLSSVSSFVTDAVNGQISSVFKYLPHVTSLTIADTAIQAVSNTITDTDKRTINLSNMSWLTSLNLNNSVLSYDESDLEQSAVDISNCTALATVSATGSLFGIKAEGSTNLTTLTLGSPVYIYLKDTAKLATVSVESSENIKSVHIENVNVAASIAFNTFNNIFV